MERISQKDIWQTVERPGYLGKKKDEMYALWNEKYGLGNWKIVNETVEKEVFSYEDIIYKVYVPGYEEYFKNHPDEARTVTDNFSYGYDKDLCTEKEAYDFYAFYNKPGIANQFHSVAFNIALRNLGYVFKGVEPLKVREAKLGTPESEQPKGYKWSPGKIPCTIPELIPSPHIDGWWSPNSIEDFYQSTKALQIKI